MLTSLQLKSIESILQAKSVIVMEKIIIHKVNTDSFFYTFKNLELWKPSISIQK